MTQTDSQIEHGVIKTLCYADIFAYPLSKEQIVNLYIGKHKSSLSQVEKALSRLEYMGIVGSRSNLFFLAGRSELIEQRAKKEFYSTKKLSIAKKIAAILSFIPTIKLIGVSGSLSLNNAKKTDDIDLFIITARNSLWLSRFLVFILLSLLKINRARKEKMAIDKICANMYMSEDDLLIDRKNLFTAREIAQLKVLFNRENIYEKFLSGNRWLLKYVPNIKIEGKIYTNFKRGKTHSFLKFTNKLLFLLQYFYMKKHITQEKISYSRAEFHPEDKTNYVLTLYRIKSRSLLKMHKIKSNSKEKKNTPVNTPGY